jgi:23S rRNA pseudouridine1911/1915/1917 synthase
MVGDLSVSRVMLHALRLEVPHPATGATAAFEAPIPDDFAAVRAALVGTA